MFGEISVWELGRLEVDDGILLTGRMAIIYIMIKCRAACRALSCVHGRPIVTVCQGNLCCRP